MPRGVFLAVGLILAAHLFVVAHGFSHGPAAEKGVSSGCLICVVASHTPGVCVAISTSCEPRSVFVVDFVAPQPVPPCAIAPTVLARAPPLHADLSIIG